jgi:hypothetical protein
MNIFNIDPDMMDDMATNYLNGMYESQYDDEDFTEEEIQNQKSISKIVESKPKNNFVWNDDEIPF